MSNINSVFSYPQTFSRQFIGLERLDNIFDQLSNRDIDNYPPYNLIRNNENQYTIEMAVAGFKPTDIILSSKNGILTVAGKIEEKEDKKYVYRGLATRNFKQEFQLAEYVQVKNAEFDNGILKINLEYELPEELKERTIPISVK